MYTNYTQDEVDAINRAHEARIGFKPNRVHVYEQGMARAEIEDITEERAEALAPNRNRNGDGVNLGAQIYLIDRLWDHPVLWRPI